jgi:hypothetical protein
MNTIYHAIARLLWHIYLMIERRNHLITPDLYLDRNGLLCTVTADHKVIRFGVRHE